uniref:Ovule protein n=1 Tax=Caenorhabditis tropicalis TaxID=1561998 RepID=A0A1I7UYL2_9PELO
MCEALVLSLQPSHLILSSSWGELLPFFLTYSSEKSGFLPIPPPISHLVWLFSMAMVSRLLHPPSLRFLRKDYRFLLL